MIINTLTSAVTGIGGHYLNKRWDKAVLFLSLFVLSWASVYLIFYLSFQNTALSPEEMTKHIEKTLQFASTLSVSIIAFLWLTSVIITFIDSKKPVESNMIYWSKSGAIGSVITSLISTIIIVFTILSVIKLSFSNLSVTQSSIDYEESSSSYISKNFYGYKYFGGNPPRPYTLPSPPEGKGILKGKFTYLGEPARNVSLAIVLNSKFRKKNISTDEHGIFFIKVPPGKWTINSIQTEKWDNKPQEGSFTIYSDHENKLINGKFNQYSHFENQGLAVNVDNNPSKIHINLKIVPRITVNWPESKKENIQASISNIVDWDEYPNAHSYYIEIKRITQNGKTTYYTPITSKIIDNSTSLPLKKLTFVKTKNKKKFKYGVKIFAFSKDGTLIAESADSYDGGTFILSDGNMLIEDSVEDLLSPSSITDPEELEEKLESIRVNKERIEAVKVLIRENMLKEASDLLSLVDTEYSKGKKEVLKGYIFALKKQCDRANEMFDKAQDINPKVCLPSRYRASCN